MLPDHQPSDRRTGSLAFSVRTVAALMVPYVGWSILTTWPLAARLGTGIASDLGDPLLNAWLLWWSAHVVPLTAAWWNAPMFFPLPGVTAFSEHLLGLLPIAGPVLWTTGNLPLAYNLTLLTTFVFSAFAAHALCF